jgi:hypothetical protein
MRKLVIAIKTVLLLAGCAAALNLSAAAHQQAGSQGAPAKAAKAPSADVLDKLLAPIALYPDQLLAQMLLCASNPGKVAALSEWLASHPNEKGTALQDAATKAGFDQSFVALVLFPDVVNDMAAKLEWTTQLGNAFAADRTAVFGSIQRLRGKAQQAGSLKDTPQQDVATKTTSSGQQVIVIEPANPQVVYVPQYNPQVVYTQPSTVVVQQSSSTDAAVAGALIGFTAGIAIGAAIDNDYYYGPYGWGRGAYMYDDAWDDWYDEREDMREDWQDHREDIVDERGDRAQNAQEQRSERTETRQENRPETQAQREQRRTDAKASGATAGSTRTAPSGDAANSARSTGESRGYSGTERTAAERSGTRSDAFSGYSSGKSERKASQRGKSSRSSSRSSGSRRR